MSTKGGCAKVNEEGLCKYQQIEAVQRPTNGGFTNVNKCGYEKTNKWGLYEIEFKGVIYITNYLYLTIFNTSSATQYIYIPPSFTSTGTILCL